MIERQWVDLVVAMQREWKSAFERRDWDALAALYAPRTAFYGSTATFYATPAGVRRYFELLPPSYFRADYAVPDVMRLADDVIAATGEVMFFTRDDAGVAEHSYRMTHVLCREQGEWRIATHHASPRPERA